MTAFMGVRISWLMRARNSPLALFAAASSRVRSATLSSSVAFCSWMRSWLWLICAMSWLKRDCNAAISRIGMAPRSMGCCRAPCPNWWTWAEKAVSGFTTSVLTANQTTAPTASMSAEHTSTRGRMALRSVLQSRSSLEAMTRVPTGLLMPLASTTTRGHSTRSDWEAAAPSGECQRKRWSRRLPRISTSTTSLWRPMPLTMEASASC